MSLLANLIRLGLCLIPLLLQATEEKPFVIILHSPKNGGSKENLQSALAQNYLNYRILYIAEDEEAIYHDRVTPILKRGRNSQLACKVQAVFMCDKREIIVDLDGPYGLANENVLAALNQIYTDPNIWMTSGSSQLCPTFYAGLFHKIRKEDFLVGGKFLQSAGNLAYMLPLSEMAGSHAHITSDGLSLSSSPLQEIDSWLTVRKKYEPLDRFPSTAPVIYDQIEDPLHPTNQDYYSIQNYLSFGKRDNIERLLDTMNAAKNVRIIGEDPDELPHMGIIPVNCSPDDRENCVVTYASFNQRFSSSLQWLVNYIAKSDYKGHVLYRIGGWPDAEGGSLSLAHVPYAFKVASIMEARRRGFKRVLWLDTSIVPLASMNSLFDLIQKKGYLMVGGIHLQSGYHIGGFMNSPAAAYFGLTLEETRHVPACSAGIAGFDFTKEIGRTIVERWDRAAQDPDAFFSARSDQNALSIILYQMRFNDFIDWGLIPHTEVNNPIKPEDLFLIDRGGQYRNAHP